MSDASQTEQAPRKRRLRTRWLIGLACLFVVVGAAYGAYWYFIARFSVATDDAYVHGNQVSLMPRVEGTVTRIDVDDTDYVARGQPVVHLDETDARVALEQAEANLAQTVRQVSQLYAQAEQQRAVIDQREATLTQAHRDYQRASQLYQKRSVSEERYQQAETDWLNAKANLKAARSALDSLQTQTRGTDPAHHPRVQAAAAEMRRAWLDLERTTVVAPVGGHVAKRSVQLGQQVSPGDPMMAIVPLDQVWVEANFKETDLTRVRIGQPVTVTADFYGSDVVYHGRVEALSAGTGSAFELLPPQNATGNWIKVVQRVPVRVRLDPDELAENPLRIGLSLTASIDVHDTSGASLTSHTPEGSRYQTRTYRYDNAALDKRIDTIIRRNLGETPAADAAKE